MPAGCNITKTLYGQNSDKKYKNLDLLVQKMDFQDFRYDYLYETSNSEPPDTQGKDTKKSFQVKNTLS